LIRADASGSFGFSRITGGASFANLFRETTTEPELTAS
jgi:hypothetical protein